MQEKEMCITAFVNRKVRFRDALFGHQIEGAAMVEKLEYFIENRIKSPLFN